MMVILLYHQGVESVAFYETHHLHPELKGVPVCESDSQPMCDRHDWILQIEVIKALRNFSQPA